MRQAVGILGSGNTALRTFLFKIDNHERSKNVIDMRPSKGFSPSQGNGHLRRLDDCERAQKVRWNYAPSREHLNFEVGKGGVVTEVNKFKTINQRIQENLDSRGIVNPNKKYIGQGLDPKYRTVANFILGGNREVMRNLAFDNQEVDWEHGADNSDLKRMPEIEAWAKDAYAFMCKKYGEKNIAAFVVHLDEANPHVHCTVLPLTEKNRFSFIKTFMGGVDSRDALSKYMENLHTEYADEVGLKYGMERGDSIKKTGAVHRTTEEYRRKLWKDAQEKEEEVRENIKTIEQQNSTITNQRGIIASLSREIKHSAARLKALATMIKNLETHKADLEQEIKKFNRDLAAGKISKEEADRKLSKINAEIKKTEEKIIDKADKLKVAESKLHDAEQRKAELEAKAHEAEEKRSSEEQKTALAVEKTAKAEGKYQVIKAKYKEIAPKVNLKVSHEFGSLGFHMAALDMKSRLSKYGELRNSLSPSQRDFLDRTVGEIFDGSLIENVAENSANLCSVAASLYLGYLNAATRIAQSCGGGGGPGTGWGKRDDENDMDFRRRCFGMAMKMMKPGRQQRLKR